MVGCLRGNQALVASGESLVFLEKDFYFKLYICVSECQFVHV